MRVFCPQLVERAKGASLVRVIWRAARGDIYIRYDSTTECIRDPQLDKNRVTISSETTVVLAAVGEGWRW